MDFWHDLYIYYCRGFNDAVNGFNDDGWSLINCDGAEDVILAVNSTKNLTTTNPANSFAFLGGILCAKASMLLQVSHKLLGLLSNFKTIIFLLCSKMTLSLTLLTSLP